MKKLLTLLAIATLVTATNITPTQSALCVQPKGQLQGTINQLEAQGYSLASIECTTINYFVAPTPPYVNRIFSVRMNRIQCPDFGTGPCYYFGSAYFTAEEVVVNKNGNTIHTNISQFLVAL